MRIKMLHTFFGFILLSIYFDQLNAHYAVEFKTIIGTRYEKYGWPDLSSRKQYVHITCLEAYKPVIYPTNTKYQGIYIYKCQVPKTPLAQQFQKSQMDITDLQILQFNDTLMDSPLPADFTVGLPVTTLGLWNLTNFHPSPKFFTSLTKLRELTFGKMEVPTLPPADLLHIETLILKYSPVKSWDNCEHIQKLEVEGLTKEQIPKEWPVSCSQLKTLKLDIMTLEATHHVIDSMTEDSLLKLEKLTIRNCSLEKLPLKLMKSKNLTSVDFSNNELVQKAILQFPPMNNLTVLKLSNNKKIYAEDLIDLLPKTPALHEIRLDGMYRVHMDSNVREALTKLTSLEKIYLNQFSGGEDIFKHNKFVNLSYLSMKNDNRHYYIDHLELHSLPSTGAQQLEVDMSGTPVNFVSIGPKFVEDFESIYAERRTALWVINKGYKLVVHLGSIDCECNNDVLWRTLREFPHFLAMPDLKCSHGGLFKDEPLENLSCRKAMVNGCLRKMSREANYTTVVDCTVSNNPEKFRWPRPRGFRKLVAAGNHISSLDKAYLPTSLKWLDLRNNSISRLNGEQASRIFGEDRRVWLAGNPIICDCDNQPLLDTLHINQSWIMDYDILTCVDTGQLLRLVSVAELCRPRSVSLLITVSTIALVGLVVALLVRHFWSTLRMILYAHGCCMSCLREKDVDQDRPYDAFLSFAHGDDKYVMEELLPQLEGKPNYYRLCVHYRDWAVGEWIPAQIMKSVQLSKRTIIVLSKNFVESCWGMMEFRHANAGAMANGSQRLIVLILDDVLSEMLTPELRVYLELNTYLKCNDPWFWEKLRYAMPHKEDKESPPRTHFENTCRSRGNAFAQYIPQLEYGTVSMKVEEPPDSCVNVDESEVPTESNNVVISFTSE